MCADTKRRPTNFPKRCMVQNWWLSVPDYKP
uniref:Uncharacterized protein n=1 Tax=Anopheles funestus TaxID=62324 RepID=A0A182S138_ANOFN